MARASRSQRRAFLAPGTGRQGKDKEPCGTTSRGRNYRGGRCTCRRKSHFRAAASHVRQRAPARRSRGMRESRSGNSGKGLLMGAIATGVLVLAGGGWWYMQRQSGGVQAGSEPASNVQASVAALPVASSPSQTQQSAPPQVNPPAQSNPPALTNASAQAKSSSNTLSVVPAVQSAPPARNSQPILNSAKSGAGVATS